MPIASIGSTDSDDDDGCDLAKFFDDVVGRGIGFEDQVRIKSRNRLDIGFTAGNNHRDVLDLLPDVEGGLIFHKGSRADRHEPKLDQGKRRHCMCSNDSRRIGGDLHVSKRGFQQSGLGLCGRCQGQHDCGKEDACTAGDR